MHFPLSFSVVWYILAPSASSWPAGVVLRLGCRKNTPDPVLPCPAPPRKGTHPQSMSTLPFPSKRLVGILESPNQAPSSTVLGESGVEHDPEGRSNCRPSASLPGVENLAWLMWKAWQVQIHISVLVPSPVSAQPEPSPLAVAFKCPGARHGVREYRKKYTAG